MDRSEIEPWLAPLQPQPTGLLPHGKLRPPLKAVLFDIYGTLFISASGDIDPRRPDAATLGRLRQLLAQWGLASSPRALLSSLAAEIQRRHAEARAQGVDFPEVDILAVWRRLLPDLEETSLRRFAVQFEFIVNPVHPMPGAAQLLAQCRRQGFVMGIVSNAQFYTPYLFSWMLGDDLQGLGFDAELVLLSYRLGRAKPSPQLFALAAERLQRRGVAAGEALYLGNDMLKDVLPARQAGFQAALFAGDRRSLRLRREDARCRDLSPEVVITELGQLAAQLAALGPVATFPG